MLNKSYNSYLTSPPPSKLAFTPKGCESGLGENWLLKGWEGACDLLLLIEKASSVIKSLPFPNLNIASVSGLSLNLIPIIKTPADNLFFSTFHSMLFN
jgi:hypothetical protein